MKKKLELKKKNKFKLKTKEEKQENSYTAIMEKYTLLSEEKNIKLGKPKIDTWYCYKDRLPPDSFDFWILMSDSINNRLEVNKAKTVLSHFLYYIHVLKIKPNFTKWKIINHPKGD